MTASVHGGPLTWELTQDDEGHREYHISHLVVTNYGDGPLTVLTASGLPAVGSYWAFGNEIDTWAYCLPKCNVRFYKRQDEDGKHQWYRVDQTFSTKPRNDRCQDQSIEDPLMEPPRLSGSFQHYQKEAMKDRFDNLLINSSHELIRGAAIEFDESRPEIHIEINYLTLDLALLCSYMETVNASPLWGLPARCIKLSDAPWERKVYGKCCYYYTVSYNFQINAVLDENDTLVSGFDRKIVDSGLKALSGHLDPTSGSWTLDNIGGVAPDPDNPNHFVQYKDLNGENTRVLLDGTGKPLVDTSNPYYWDIEKFPNANFLLLGIPTEF